MSVHICNPRNYLWEAAFKMALGASPFLVLHSCVYPSPLDSGPDLFPLFSKENMTKIMEYCVSDLVIKRLWLLFSLFLPPSISYLPIFQSFSHSPHSEETSHCLVSSHWNLCPTTSEDLKTIKSHVRGIGSKYLPQLSHEMTAALVDI